jgi:hypothetical protein
MKVTEFVETARKAHETLRARVAGTRPDDRSSAAYKTLKSALDRLLAAVQQRPDVKQIRNAIGKLTTDAEFFAGRNDDEGFRDAADVWQQYDNLKQALDSVYSE